MRMRAGLKGMMASLALRTALSFLSAHTGQAVEDRSLELR